jgi:hypothetical protein
MVDGASAGQVSTYTFNDVSASHTIEVVFEIDSFTVTASAGSGGTITPGGATTADYGSSVNYTITPDANYHIVKVLVDGSSVGQVSGYTFENISASHTIEAVFEIDTFTLTATAGVGGTISPEGVVNTAYGSSVSYTITPDANCHVADVLVDGASVGAVTAYTFENISATHTIQAVFEIDVLSVAAVSGTGGTISPAGVTAVTYGSSMTCTITPDTNYHIADVMVDGVSVGQIDSYSFENITVSHTIEATFEIDTFTITAAAGAGGTISHEGVKNAASGSSVSYTITPAENYHISDVVVDGVSVGAVASYVFENISASHIIEAVFEIDTFSIVTTVSGNGTLTPEGAIEVAYGANQVFSMVPETGYVIEDVRVDGESVGAVAEYTFSDIAADHTLETVFVEAIPGFGMETGSIAATDGWQQVSFERTFTDPVVVAATRNIDLIGALVIRINNVTETGFEIKVAAESAVDTNATETTIDYVVMEAGSFTLPDGTVVEADTVVTEDVTGAGSHTFTGIFSEAPGAGASVVTCNNLEDVKAVLNNVSSTGFDCQIEGPDTDADGHLSEMVSFIAIGQWQSPLSDAMTAAGITEEMMTFTSEVVAYSQPAANGIDTGTPDDGSTDTGGDTGTPDDGGTDTGGDTGSTDGDTTTPPDDNTGNVGGGNHSPDRPTATSSTIEISGVGPVVLSLEAFTDADAGDYHVETEWQVFEVESETFIASIVSDSALTEFSVPSIMLEQNTRYSWHARFMDNNGGVSEWSEAAYFVTGESETDLDGNGIPDAQEVDASVDTNRDGIPDVEQDGIKSIILPSFQKPIGLSIENSDSATAILSLEAVNTDTPVIVESLKKRRRKLPHGLINFRLAVAEPGAAAFVTVHFAEPVHHRAKWMKLDLINNVWIDYTGYAQFSQDRMSVVLEYVDGGFGDDDGVANGIIVDPAGLELAVSDDASDASTVDSGDSDTAAADSTKSVCFISGAAGSPSPGWPVVAAIFLLLFSGIAAERWGCKRK